MTYAVLIQEGILLKKFSPRTHFWIKFRRIYRNSNFNQSMVSRLYNGVDVPKTLTAVRNWISKESEKMKKTREFRLEL
uniref:Uncharacterized protein n=1 Tax=Rhizophagus irregularis (strain DAOM 181602 / DAOM 197198 / MUCL 43194) TaxID=747089 RepID=U9THP9_RHIID